MDGSVSEDPSRVRWLFNFEKWTPSEEQWKLALSKLPTVEVDRIGRFRKPINGIFVTGKDNPNAKSSLIGWLMLISCARRAYSDLPAEQIKITRSKEGKPYVEVPDKNRYVHFNMNASHSGEYVAFGCEPSYLVGIDVMENHIPHNTPTLEFFESMESCFTPAEWSYIYRGRTNPEKEERFFTMWCLKESYIKAVGIGLGFELQRAQFTVNNEQNPTSATVTIDKIPRPDWVFEIHKDNSHIMAVAYGPLIDTAQGYQQAALPDLYGNAKLRNVIPEASKIERVPFKVLSFEDLIASLERTVS